MNSFFFLFLMHFALQKIKNDYIMGNHQFFATPNNYVARTLPEFKATVRRDVKITKTQSPAITLLYTHKFRQVSIFYFIFLFLY